VAASGACARCSGTVRFELRPDVLIYADRRGKDKPADEAVLEEDGVVLYHDGSELDLRGLLREAVILEIPQVLLCRPECKGLCPLCGRDLNEAACSCRTSDADPRWEALRNLESSKDRE
jgi:uncharacterized protein